MKSDFAAQARQLSNLGHMAEGALFAALGLLALLQALGFISNALLALTPLLMIAAGITIPVILFGHSHKGQDAGMHRRVVLNDPQQRQHLIMASLVLLSGLAEFARLAGILAPLSGYVWSVALVLIGVMFMRHTQHGEHAAMMQALRFHRILGGVIAAAGIVRGIQGWIGDERGLFAFAYALVLLVVAALLLTYREPAGAYTNAAPGEHDAHSAH